MCVCACDMCVCMCKWACIHEYLNYIYLYKYVCDQFKWVMHIWRHKPYQICELLIYNTLWIQELLNKLDLTGIKVLYETIHAGETIFIWMGCSFIMIFMMSCICEVLSHEWIVWGISQLWYSNYIMWTLACKWIDGWVYGQVDGWMNEWIDEWMDRWMDGWKDRWMDGWVVGWMDG